MAAELTEWGKTHIIIDVSHWNPGDGNPDELDWKAAAASGVIAVIVKMTQGLNSHDPAYPQHLWGAYEAGITNLGTYHFGDGNDAKTQAMKYLDAVHAEFDTYDKVMLMLDAETNKPQMTVEGAELFVQTVFDQTKRYPWLYTGRFGPDGTGYGFPSSILSQCKLLIAAYGPHETNLGDYLPKGFRLPNDGADRGDAGAGLVRGWQYSDGTNHGGPVSGLGRVDQSYSIGYATEAEFVADWAA